jgi:outer membrane protein assembly factor BamB
VPEVKNDNPAGAAPAAPTSGGALPATPNSFQPAAPAPEAPPGTPAAPPASDTPPAANTNPPGGQGGGGGGGGGGGRRGGMSEPATEIYQFVVMCLDRQTGNVLWQHTPREELPHEGHHPDHSFCSYSPVTDGTCIIAYFGSRGMYCYDMQGNLKWSKDLGRMQIKNEFGEGSSPALYGNTVVVNWDHEGDDFIAGFNKETGEELWRTPREEGTTWGTPLVVNFDGKPQVIVNATGHCRSYDLATGQQVWEAPGLTTNAIPSPVGADGMVYCMSGFRGSKLLAIKLGSTGDLTGTDAIAWTYDKDTPYVPSPMLYGNRLYITKSNNAILTCLDAKTGTVLYGPERLEGVGNFYASPVGAAGRVYLVGRDGTTLVIKDADTLEVLATNKLDDPIDASPAVAGKELYLRSKEYLYCISAP